LDRAGPRGSRDRSPRRFAIASKGSDRIIGGIGLDGDPGADTDEAALGYWLGQPYWGRGYAREAVAALLDYGFRTLGLNSIRAYTDPANTASQKVLLSCGLAYLVAREERLSAGF
jgi:[ribosomal protein S5]-alanine N-acetyltransferase